METSHNSPNSETKRLGRQLNQYETIHIAGDRTENAHQDIDHLNIKHLFKHQRLSSDLGRYHSRKNICICKSTSTNRHLPNLQAGITYGSAISNNGTIGTIMMTLC